MKKILSSLLTVAALANAQSLFLQEEPAELKLAPLPYSGKVGEEPAKCKWDPNSYANCD